MKKALALLLVLMVLVPSLALAEIPGYWNPPSVNQGQYPFGDGSTKLTYWMAINAGAANFISSYDENPAYDLIQKNTGIDIEFIHPTVGMVKDQFNLMMVSGELPDIIQIPQTGYYEGGLKKMYEDGAIIDLSPYLEQYAPQYLACVNHSDIAQKQIIEGDNGEIFGFYRLSHAGFAPYFRMNVQGRWLQEFDMTEPMTIAEYEQYFENILANKPDATPLYVDFKNTGYVNLLIGAFDILMDFYDHDGTIGYYANAPEYREFLKLMNEWYNKGYISKDFASLTNTEVSAMFDNGTLGMYADSVDVVYARTKNLAINATNCPYMRKEKDSVLGSEGASYPVDSGVAYVSVVTSACKNVEAAVALLNYSYTYEGGLIANWGVEGISYTWGEDGFPKWTDTYLHNPEGMTTSNVAYALRCHLGSKYTYSDLICGLVDEAQIINRTKWNNDENVTDRLRLPPINLSADELTERTELLNKITTYAQEMMFKFITGAESLDNWDTYVNRINGMGLLEAVEIVQAAYDRY